MTNRILFNEAIINLFQEEGNEKRWDKDFYDISKGFGESKCKRETDL